MSFCMKPIADKSVLTRRLRGRIWTKVNSKQERERENSFRVHVKLWYRIVSYDIVSNNKVKSDMH